MSSLSTVSRTLSLVRGAASPPQRRHPGRSEVEIRGPIHVSSHEGDASRPRPRRARRGLSALAGVTNGPRVAGLRPLPGVTSGGMVSPRCHPQVSSRFRQGRRPGSSNHHQAREAPSERHKAFRRILDPCLRRDDRERGAGSFVSSVPTATQDAIAGQGHCLASPKASPRTQRSGDPGPNPRVLARGRRFEAPPSPCTPGPSALCRGCQWAPGRGPFALARGDVREGRDRRDGAPR